MVHIVPSHSSIFAIIRSIIFNQKIINMVTKAILNILAFASIEEYFEFILYSKDNGHDGQARDLFNVLSPDDSGGGKGQRTKFFNWFVEQMDEPETLTEVSNFKNYFL